MMSDWPNAIAHIDADCFFASCELTRRPELIGTPVCILSSQDACIVAKTYDAKAIGIKTGMPVWEAKKLMPHATYIPADFRYYGLLSEKMFSILRRFSPDIEAYSIDEAFLDMNGLRSLWRKGFREIAHDIRRSVHEEVGITVSVGVSVTRTLAKMASEYNKPNGVTIVAGRVVDQFLERVSRRRLWPRQEPLGTPQQVPNRIRAGRSSPYPTSPRQGWYRPMARDAWKLCHGS